MRRTAGMGVIFVLLVGLVGCTGGKYGDLPEAPAGSLEKAQALWKAYVEALGAKEVAKQPERVAGFFARPLVASLQVDAFGKAIEGARHKRSAGLLGEAKVESVRKAPDGLMMVMDTKAGEVGIPLADQDGALKFASLEAACGEWTKEAARGPSAMPAKPSLLYIKMLLADGAAPMAERLKAAVGLAETRYRAEIIAAQKRISDPIVKLGLGLARIRIDGTDDSFVRTFPTQAARLTKLAGVDKAIFEEMLVKLTNLASMVEDPPVNEVLFKAAAAAPAELRPRFGKALYDMAEASPQRFANAVFSLVKDMDTNEGLAVYFEEVGRRGGKAPKVEKFIKKFSRQGEGPEKDLCKGLLAQFRKRK